MNYDDDEVIHLDYNSDDDYAIPEDNYSEDIDEEDGEDEEGESESKLMEYLLKGLVLQSSTCGHCDTPLVKSLVSEDSPTILTAESPVEPISNVPYCVACCAHVVTNQEELQVMWKDENKALMGVDGAVRLFMGDEIQDAAPVFGKMSLATESGSGEEAVGIVMDENTEDNVESVDEEEDEIEKEGENAQLSEYELEVSSRPMSSASARSMNSGRSRPMSSSSARSMNSGRSGSGALRAPEVINDGNLNYDLIDYDKRRNIATKVLGTKMIEGYSLRETQCDKCTMPMMETPDASGVICVVCPVLQKKVQKLQLKQQKALEKEESATQMAMEAKIRLEREEKQRKQEEERLAVEAELAKAHEEEARLIEQQRKEELRKQLEEEAMQSKALRKKAAKEAAERQLDDRYDEKDEIATEAELSVEDERKLTLRKQIQQERRRIDDMKFKRQVQDDNLDEEEVEMLEQLRLAKVEREREEERVREQLLRKRKAHEQERLRLIEELRLAKEARAQDEIRREKEIKAAEKRSQEAKKSEDAREQERQKLIEELRVARQERMMEEMRRKEEALKADKLIKLRDQEQKRMKAELDESIQSQKVQELVRKAELEKAEMKAKAAEEELQKWRNEAEEAAKQTESVRQAAEQRVKEAEQAKRQAQALADEAKRAKALARAEKVRLSERQRLNELAHRAEKYRAAAEAEAQRAQKALLRAEQKADQYYQQRDMHEGVLSRQVHEATHNVTRFMGEDTFDGNNDYDDMHDEEDYGIPSRIGVMPGLTAASAGNDWEARSQIGKQVLASRLMMGWTVLPEYCFGRMCNFTPIIAKGDLAECVVCEGCGNGEDGAYLDTHPDDILDDTISFAEKKQQYEHFSSSMRRMNFDSNEVGSREVGRRLQLGWQLLDSPCPACLMPLMAEAQNSPEMCVFCDPEDDIEIGDDGDMGINFRDDRSVSSRQSVTIELPPNFDPSDPNSMAQLAVNAAAASSGQSVVSRSSRHSRANSRARSRSQQRQRPNILPGGRMGPRSISGRQSKLPARPLRMRSESPRPENRGALSSSRGGGRSNSRTRRKPESMNGARRYTQDDDDASTMSNDNMSVAQSVASHTLDAIMSKINDCKATLSAPIDTRDSESIAAKGEAAALLQKLTAAAAAVKDFE